MIYLIDAKKNLGWESPNPGNPHGNKDEEKFFTDTSSGMGLASRGRAGEYIPW